jgi:hypothetical protein
LASFLRNDPDTGVAGAGVMSEGGILVFEDELIFFWIDF